MSRLKKTMGPRLCCYEHIYDLMSLMSLTPTLSMGFPPPNSIMCEQIIEVMMNHIKKTIPDFSCNKRSTFYHSIIYFSVTNIPPIAVM